MKMQGKVNMYKAAEKRTGKVWKKILINSTQQ